MPDNLNFVDDSRLTNSPKQYTSDGKIKSKLIKMTEKSRLAFKKAVNKRLNTSIHNLNKDKMILTEEYKNTHAELERDLKQATLENRSNIDHLADQFDYLAQLGVRLVNTDRKLQTLNDRLVINNKKTFNLKGATFKRIVSNISALKASILDKYIDKKVVTKKYEDSKDQIDKMMSEGKYYTAEQTLKKMVDYNSMTLGSNNANVMEDIYSNPNMAEASVTNTPEQFDTNLSSTSSDDMENSNVLEPVEPVEITPIDELDNIFVSNSNPIPASFVPVEETQVEETTPQVDVVTDDIPEMEFGARRSSDTTYGIDFTKLIKKSTEPVVENVVSQVTENETLVEGTNNPLENQTSSGDNEVTSDETEIQSQETVEPVVESISESETEPLVASDESATKESEVDLDQIVVDRLVDFDGLASELGVNLETNVEETVEPIFNENEAQETLENTTSVVSEIPSVSSREIDGQVGFDAINMNSDVNMAHNETLIPPTPSASLVEMFKNIDEITAELNSEKQKYVHDIDVQAQNAIDEIEAKTANLIEESVEPEPIVVPTEQPVSIAESQVQENAKIDGEEIKLDHELLKKLYDMVTARDMEIAELKTRLEAGTDYNSFETMEEKSGKKM